MFLCVISKSSTREAAPGYNCRMISNCVFSPWKYKVCAITFVYTYIRYHVNPTINSLGKPSKKREYLKTFELFAFPPSLPPIIRTKKNKDILASCLTTSFLLKIRTSEFFRGVYRNN